MALFGTPEQHAANPPESWRVVKVAERTWRLTDTEGVTLDTCTTRRAAELAKVKGFWVNLYEKERRWLAGELVAGWKPYVE